MKPSTFLHAALAAIAAPFQNFFGGGAVHEIPMAPRGDYYTKPAKSYLPPNTDPSGARKHPFRGIAVPAHYNIERHL